ncbi:Ig-like domain-containing protein [Nanoarchaeota archaeon]
MNKAILTGLCIILLIIPISYASQIAFESAALGRIVGDSPAEMEQLLDQDSITLDHAGYFSDHYSSPFSTTRSEEVAEIIQANFPGEYETSIPSYTSPEDGWMWTNVDSIVSGWNKDSLLVLETDGKISFNTLKADSPVWLDSDLRPSSLWDTSRDKLVVFDSHFAGIHLPKFESFVSEMDTTIIAPTAIPDEEFVKVFLCNLGNDHNDNNLGKTYRNTRNNYYWQTNRPSGLSLMSYELYGNPLMDVSIRNYNENIISTYCKDYIKDFDDHIGTQSMDITSNIHPKDQNSIGIQSLFTNLYVNDVTYTIPSHNIAKQGEHSVLTIPGTLQHQRQDELVLPRTVIPARYPLRTVVNNVSLTSLGQPIDITISDLPMWQGELYNRTCYNNTAEPGVTYSHSFTENEEVVLVEVNPVEVLDCETGRLRLYREIKYSIDYLPGSPLLFDTYTIPDEVLPGQNTSITATMKNMKAESVDGMLVLRDGNTVVSQKEIHATASGTQAVLPFTVPEKEGLKTYYLQFWHDGEMKTELEVSTRVVLLDARLWLPVTTPSTISIPLELYNNKHSTLNTDINYYLKKNDQIIQSGSLHNSFGFGFNIVNFQLTNMTKADQSYDLLVDLIYDGLSQSISATLTTNHAPVLSYIPSITVDEGQRVQLNLSSQDMDHDYLTYTISSPFDNNQIWYPDYNSEGNYTTTVTVSDGLLQDTQTVNIQVINKEDPKKVIFRDCNFGLYRGGFAEVAVDFDFNNELESWYFTGYSELNNHFGFKTNEDWPVGSCGFKDQNFCIEDSDKDDPDWYLGQDSNPDAVFTKGGTCLTSPEPDATYKDHEICEGNINCTYPFCTFNYECGQDSWVGDFYCNDNSNSVDHDYRTYTCTDPASDYANCSYIDTSIQMENCSTDQKCYNGLCLDVTCYSNSDCGTDGYLEDYCTPNGIYKNYRTHTCNNAATVNSTCTFDDQSSYVTTCSSTNQTCIYGQCVDKSFYILGKFNDGKEQENALFTILGNHTFYIKVPYLAEIRTTQIIVEGGP